MGGSRSVAASVALGVVAVAKASCVMLASAAWPQRLTLRFETGPATLKTPGQVCDWWH